MTESDKWLPARGNEARVTSHHRGVGSPTAFELVWSLAVESRRGREYVLRPWFLSFDLTPKE